MFDQRLSFGKIEMLIHGYIKNLCNKNHILFMANIIQNFYFPNIDCGLNVGSEITFRELSRRIMRSSLCYLVSGKIIYYESKTLKLILQSPILYYQKYNYLHYICCKPSENIYRKDNTTIKFYKNQNIFIPFELTDQYIPNIVEKIPPKYDINKNEYPTGYIIKLYCKYYSSIQDSFCGLRLNLTKTHDKLKLILTGQA